MNITVSLYGVWGWGGVEGNKEFVLSNAPGIFFFTIQIKFKADLQRANYSHIFLQFCPLLLISLTGSGLLLL